jgi:hypothetical protein
MPHASTVAVGARRHIFLQARLLTNGQVQQVSLQPLQIVKGDIQIPFETEVVAGGMSNSRGGGKGY